jgi:hypothetical protein
MSFWNWRCKETVIFRFFREIAKSDLSSSCLSVRPSVCIEQIGSHWTDFNEIWYLCIFRITVEKLQVSLKSNKKKGYFTWKSVYIFDHISLNCSYNEKCFGQKCRENQATHFVFGNFFRKSYRLWDNVEKNIAERGRPRMTIWRMCITCWIHEATNIYSQYVRLIAFPLEQ